jgi:hypothetical protein
MVLSMTITPDSVIKFAGFLTALTVIVAAILTFCKWYLKLKHQSADIKEIKKEQAMICYGLLACFDGLKQLKCNGNVSKAYEKFEKYLNLSAHDIGNDDDK